MNARSHLSLNPNQQPGEEKSFFFHLAPTSTAAVAATAAEAMMTKRGATHRLSPVLPFFSPCVSVAREARCGVVGAAHAHRNLYRDIVLPVFLMSLHSKCPRHCEGEKSYLLRTRRVNKNKSIVWSVHPVLLK